MIKVVSKERRVKGAVYVGRPTALGNPYTVQKYGREEAIQLYRKWLWNEIQNNRQGAAAKFFYGLVVKYRNNGRLVLECHCSPNSCHADVLKAAIEWAVRQ